MTIRKENVTNLSEHLLSLGGTSIFSDQISYDPDCEQILNNSKTFFGEKICIEMLPNACHWNISELFEKKLVDQIVIGYALSSDNVWFQHTWGMKNNILVETSKVNFFNIKVYYGMILEDPSSFVILCNNNPKGNGKVRRNK